MRAFAPPSGYLSLRDARDELIRQMHEGVSPSEKTKQRQQEGYNVLDFAQTMAAVKALREAILSGDLDLYAYLHLDVEPRRLTLEQCQSAAQLKDGSVLSFFNIVRMKGTPIDLSWSETRKLAQNPLCINEKAFRDWLKMEARKTAWPCHGAPLPKRRRGAPPKIDEVMEIIEQLKALGKLRMKCECRSSLKLETIHELVLKQAPHLSKPKAEIIETVRRALEELELLSAQSTRTLKKWSNGHCSGCKWRTSIR